MSYLYTSGKLKHTSSLLIKLLENSKISGLMKTSIFLRTLFLCGILSKLAQINNLLLQPTYGAAKASGVNSGCLA